MIITVPFIFISLPNFLSANSANFGAIAIEVSSANCNSSVQELIRIYLNPQTIEDFIVRLRTNHSRNFGRATEVKEYYSDRD